MKSIFDPDNWFWRGFGRLADYFILSMVWMACSIPLITVGTASIALYDAVTYIQDGSMVRRFFHTFKQELLRGILMTLLWAVISYLLSVGYNVVRQLGGDDMIWMAFRVFYCVTLALPLSVMCWAVAMESRFTYGFGELHRNALLITFAHLPQTLAIVALLAASVYAGLRFPYLILFLPAAMSHLQSVFIEKVFIQYMPVEGSTEIE